MEIEASRNPLDCSRYRFAAMVADDSHCLSPCCENLVSGLEIRRPTLAISRLMPQPTQARRCNFAEHSECDEWESEREEFRRPLIRAI